MARLSERFHVGKKLGSGGAGHVYPARDRSSGEVIAVKMIRNVDHDDPNFVERFKREGAIHQDLRGRHILKVHEHGAWDEGLAILMELAGGPSLAGAIDAVKERGERPFDRLFPLLDQAMSGVAEVHAVDVIHRDLKPENILTTIERGHLVAKVADFGLARNVDNSMTRTNTAMGTPCYASPEQFRDASRVDHRTDIYSFRVMLYQLLTGVRPYDGDSFLSVGNACVNGQWRLPRELDTSLPPAADDLIQTAMALHVDDRFASMQALQAAARGLAADLGVDLAARVPADIAPGPPVEFGEDKGPPPPPPKSGGTNSAVVAAAGGGVALLGMLAVCGLIAVGIGGAWYMGFFDGDEPVVVDVDEPVAEPPVMEKPVVDEPVKEPVDDPVVETPQAKPSLPTVNPVKETKAVVAPKDEVITEIPEEVVLARLSLIASPGTVDAGGSARVTLNAVGSDGAPYAISTWRTEVSGGTLSKLSESNPGEYVGTLTAGGSTPATVTAYAEGKDTRVSVNVRPKVVDAPPVQNVTLKFTCIGCSSDMEVTDSQGNVQWVSASGQSATVAAGALTIKYGGISNTVYVTTANTKVKCTQAGCKPQ